MTRKKKAEAIVELVKESLLPLEVVDELVKEAEETVVETFADITVDEMLPVSDEIKEDSLVVADELEDVKDPVVGEVLFPLVVGLVADGYQASDIKARVKAIAAKLEIAVDLTKFYEQRFTKEMILVLSELK